MTYRLPARYLPPRRYRYPYRRYRRGGNGKLAPAVVAAAIAVAFSGAGGKALTRAAGRPAQAARAGSPAGRAAAAWAEARVGRVPYLWAGTTGAGMDCSGLTQAAWASAGVSIRRTSQDQWASERHVAAPAAGDLVFFAGSDGTPSSPGHVGIVVNPARHLMVDAYASGTLVRYDTYGLPSSAGGLDSPAGFTDPAKGGTP